MNPLRRLSLIAFSVITSTAVPKSMKEQTLSEKPMWSKLTFPEFHFEIEAKVDFPSACKLGQMFSACKFEQMFSNLNRALSLAITSFGNKFCLEKRSGLITALDNSFYVKFMQLEIGLFT